MSRTFSLAKCNTEDINKLRILIQDPGTEARLKQRAQSILLTLDGKNGKEIAKELNVRENSVSSWRRAFNNSGIEGLFDKENPGRRGKNAPNLRLQVIDTLKEVPPDGAEEWTTESLSKVVGTSVDTVRRALRDHYIKLGSSSSWKINAGTFGNSKVVGIVGLYLSTQESAIILCISSTPVTYRLSGNILTHDRVLSNEYQALYDRDGCISLKDAIHAALENPVSEKKANSADLTSFVSAVCSSVSLLPNSDIIVFLYNNNSSKSNHLNSNNSKVIIDLSDSLEQWLWKMNFVITMMSLKNNGSSSVNELQSAIQKYFEKKKEQIEPLQWIIKSDEIALTLN